MTHQPAAPSEADAPRPWARAILHAQIPVALKLLLLALFAALSLASTSRRMLRAPRKDWFISAHTNPNDHHETVIDWYELRRRRRARAELGWLLRGTRNKGMANLGNLTPALCPAQPARAPPRARTLPRTTASAPDHLR